MPTSSSRQPRHIFKVFMPLSEGVPSGTPIHCETGNLWDLPHDRHGEHRKWGKYMEVGSAEGVLVQVGLVSSPTSGSTVLRTPNTTG